MWEIPLKKLKNSSWSSRCLSWLHVKSSTCKRVWIWDWCRKGENLGHYSYIRLWEGGVGLSTSLWNTLAFLFVSINLPSINEIQSLRVVMALLRRCIYVKYGSTHNPWFIGEGSYRGVSSRIWKVISLVWDVYEAHISFSMGNTSYLLVAI